MGDVSRCSWKLRKSELHNNGDVPAVFASHLINCIYIAR